MSDASFAYFSGHLRTLRNATTQMCLTVLNASAEATTRLYWEVCDGRASQDWRFEYPGAGAYIIHTAINDGLCIDQSAAPVTSTIYIWSCHGEGNQRWVPERLADDTYLLHTVQFADTCLATTLGDTSHAWTCAQSDPHQTFLIEQ